MGVALLLFGHSNTGYLNCHIIKNKKADNTLVEVNSMLVGNAVATFKTATLCLLLCSFCLWLKKCTFQEDDPLTISRTSEHLLQDHS